MSTETGAGENDVILYQCPDVSCDGCKGWCHHKQPHPFMDTCLEVCPMENGSQCVEVVPG